MGVCHSSTDVETVFMRQLQECAHQRQSFKFVELLAVLLGTDFFTFDQLACHIRTRQIPVDFLQDDDTVLDESTPLWAAVFKGQERVVALLLECKANPNVCGSGRFHSTSALCRAVYQSNAFVVTQLIAAGVDLVHAHGAQPLVHFAVSLGDVGVLSALAKHPQFNVNEFYSDESGDCIPRSLLQQAVRNCRLQCVETLLELKADPNRHATYETRVGKQSSNSTIWYVCNPGMRDPRPNDTAIPRDAQTEILKRLVAIPDFQLSDPDSCHHPLQMLVTRCIHGGYEHWQTLTVYMDAMIKRRHNYMALLDPFLGASLGGLVYEILFGDEPHTIEYSQVVQQGIVSKVSVHTRTDMLEQLVKQQQRQTKSVYQLFDKSRIPGHWIDLTHGSHF